MNRFLVVLAGLSIAMTSLAAPSPVLVELFTSEGCSSCPPADALLSRLQQTQLVEGAHVIVLSEHVDYWNQLGWTDAFSSNAFTARQQRYARVLPNFDVYTPQMVVDGKAEFVGSDERVAISAIKNAARSPKTVIDLGCSGAADLQVRIDNLNGVDADVMLAITEDGLWSNVRSGENKGRLMAHSGVTRKLSSIGRIKRQQAFRGQNRLDIENSWKRKNVSAIVFLQDRSNLHVLGASQVKLSACRAK